MIASLGMYDPPWLHRANDALWRGIAEHLAAQGVTDVPSGLTRDAPLDAIWTAPDLVLAQTCGYPLTMRLDPGAHVVATPLYDAPGCADGWHCSALVVRHDDPAVAVPDLAGRDAAINAGDSNSGMNLLRAMVAPHARAGRFFGDVVETGAHAASVAAVRSGRADCAAIDAVTWALLQDHDPELGRTLRVLEWSERTPGLPLITRRPELIPALQAALDAARPDPALRITGFARIDRADYAVIPAIEARAVALGYPALA